MADDISEAAKVSFETISEQMSEDRGRLLATIARAEHAIPTGRLREATGVPSGSMHYHLSYLEDWGLVQVSGRRDGGRGSPSKVWALTDRGQEYLDRDITSAARQAEQLQERVDQLEDDIEALKTAYNELAGVVEELVNEK